MIIISICTIIIMNDNGANIVNITAFANSCTNILQLFNAFWIAFQVFELVYFMVDGKKMEGSVTKTVKKELMNISRTANIKENIRIINTVKGGTLSRVTDMTRQYKKNVLADKADDQTLTWGSVVNTRPQCCNRNQNHCRNNSPCN